MPSKTSIAKEEKSVPVFIGHADPFVRDLIKLVTLS